MKERWKNEIIGLINNIENVNTLEMLYFFINRVLRKENAAPTAK
jgi:hypothetical protein